MCIRDRLDHAADQMVKQIQLAGGVNDDTDELFDFLCSEITGASDIDYKMCIRDRPTRGPKLPDGAAFAAPAAT